MTLVTPHDIAQLAWTRRQDPELALRIATEAGRQLNPLKPEYQHLAPAGKETKENL